MRPRDIDSTVIAALPPLVLRPPPAPSPPPCISVFPSADGQTEIVSYLFTPSTIGPHPAVVMLHGRAGTYSANDNEDCTRVARDVAFDCNPSTLSKRHEPAREDVLKRATAIFVAP